VIRLYVPATLLLLAELGRTGSVTVGDEVVLASDRSEDAEYDALMTAAEISALAARALDVGHRRRVVIVAEVPTVGGSIDIADVVAVHADTDDVPDGVDPADLDDLGWYATHEICDLLRG
jgi:hypothetical protein